MTLIMKGISAPVNLLNCEVIRNNPAPRTKIAETAVISANLSVTMKVKRISFPAQLEWFILVSPVSCERAIPLVRLDLLLTSVLFQKIYNKKAMRTLSNSSITTTINISIPSPPYSVVHVRPWEIKLRLSACIIFPTGQIIAYT